MDAFDKIGERTPNYTKKYISRNLALVELIFNILDRKRLTQKDLAMALGKSPSEVSRWMTGLHNFSFKTIAKIEEALGEELVFVKVQSMHSTLKFAERETREAIFASARMASTNKSYVSLYERRQNIVLAKIAKSRKYKTEQKPAKWTPIGR